ncbi:MAG: hypothetical protein DRH93_21460 [Deltaproteobacteria bacterium]|nr:MAG: hypothetical protein DRH93_21460 [Deltaproteobacteria bacterium]
MFNPGLGACQISNLFPDFFYSFFSNTIFQVLFQGSLNTIRAAFSVDMQRCPVNIDIQYVKI